MHRLLIRPAVGGLIMAAIAAAPLVAVAPAAPVPTHLMPEADHLPTVVGTRLVYDSHGTEMTLVVTKVEEVAGGRAVTTEVEEKGGKRRAHRRQLVTQKGLFLCAEVGQDYEPPWCVLPSPHAAGATWAFEATRRPDLTVVGTGKVVGSERVRVPAGEFTAVRVTKEYSVNGAGRHVTTTYYAPGVGLVRQDGRNGFRLVLKKVFPGKP